MLSGELRERVPVGRPASRTTPGPGPASRRAPGRGVNVRGLAIFAIAATAATAATLVCGWLWLGGKTTSPPQLSPSQPSLADLVAPEEPDLVEAAVEVPQARGAATAQPVDRDAEGYDERLAWAEEPTSGQVRPSPTTAAPEASSSSPLPPASTPEPERAVWGSSTAAEVWEGSTSAGHGVLTARSNPMGARVHVGATMVGLTPLVGKEIAEGSHVVRFELDGYSTVSKVANIREGQPSNLGTVQLESSQPLSGFVTLWADELTGAKLYVDNRYVGKLPAKVQLEEGHHSFVVHPIGGELFTITRDVHFDVQGIGISLEISAR